MHLSFTILFFIEHFTRFFFKLVVITEIASTVLNPKLFLDYVQQLFINENISFTTA